MDRLVIESTLSDVDEVSLSMQDQIAGKTSVVLSFKAANTDQVMNAMESLKELSGEGIEFLICKTLQSGIFDLEIRCANLDEPIRLMNKAISHEKLDEIENYINSGKALVLIANVCKPGYDIAIKRTEIKDCSVKV